MSRWRAAVRLLRLMAELAPREMAITGAATLAIGLAPLLPLWALRQVVDAAGRAAGGGSAAPALAWAAVLVAAYFLEQAVEIVGRLVRDRVQEEVKSRAQERVIAKAQALPLADFEQPEVYDQLQRIERGLDHRLFSTITFLFQIAGGVVTLAALLCYIGAAHAFLPVLLTLGSAAAVLIQVRSLREQFILERGQTERERRLSYFSHLMTDRGAAAELRLFGLRDPLLGAWSRLHGELRHERLAAVRRRARLAGIGMTGGSLTTGAALTFVVFLIAGGRLTVGQYAAFFSAVERFQADLFGLLWSFALVDNDLRTIHDFFLYLDRPEEPRGGVQLPPGPPREGVRFEGVGFTYPGAARPALREIDLVLRPGERVALVGENGAGKTTLARLLLGLYRPTTGRITVDGVDLARIDPADWRRRAAAVFQEFQQYHLTLRENIALGDLDRGDDPAAIERAARLAGVEGVAAALPRGYDTLLGKAYAEGVELSLGQWQKIAVARAFLREADLLVLDEPTAALDPRAEVELYREFRDLSHGKTVLLISHRLGSARLADRILVLAEGTITEEGSHAELMARRGRYARMVGIQGQWYAPERSRAGSGEDGGEPEGESVHADG